MSTASAYLTVAGINVDVVYKDIKNLHIGVYPPVGRVRVAAPHRLDDDTGAPRGHPAAAVDQAPAGPAPGRRTPVAAGDGLRRVALRLGEPLSAEAGRAPWSPTRRARWGPAVLYVPDGTSIERRRGCSTGGTARSSASGRDLIAEWEPRIGEQVSRWKIRRMKTKWGSCNPDAGPSGSTSSWPRSTRRLEYIVVHEMTHLLERSHGDASLGSWTASCPTGGHGGTS